MHLADGNIPVVRSRLSEGTRGVDQTVAIMQEMALGPYGARSAKIRALAINIINRANVANKDYYGMIVALGEWVRDNVRYIKDPVGQETLSYAEETAFNSLAADCDDVSILLIALLGSLGIRAFPVVIGLTPDAYSHVYVYAVVPPGRHRHAGERVAIDAIMREWPIGKEAPADKVRAKKTYQHLAGLGNMNLGSYAEGPAYLNEAEAAQVPATLRRRSVDAGSYGEVFTTAKVQQGEEGVDSLFSMEMAPESEVYSRGPVQAADAAGSVEFLGTPRSYEAHTSTKPLHLGRVGRGNAKVTKVIHGDEAFDSPFMENGDPAPRSTVKPLVTPQEVEGLADYLAGLAAEISRSGCGYMSGLAGPSDPLHRAAAAAHYARQRARKARRTAAGIVQMASQRLGRGPETDQAVEDAEDADAIATAAEQVAARAEQVAAKATAGSPKRRAALQADLNRLTALDRFYGVTDIVACTPDGGHLPLTAVGVNVETVGALGRMLPVPRTTPVRRNGLVTPLPHAQVIDQRGQTVEELVEYTDVGDGMGSLSGPSAKKSRKKAMQKVAAMARRVKEAGLTNVNVFAKKAGKKWKVGYANMSGRTVGAKQVKAAVRNTMSRPLPAPEAEAVDTWSDPAVPTEADDYPPPSTPPVESLTPPMSSPAPVSMNWYMGSAMPVPGGYDANASVPGGAPVDDFGPEELGPAMAATGPTTDEEYPVDPNEINPYAGETEDAVGPYEAQYADYDADYDGEEEGAMEGLGTSLATASLGIGTLALVGLGIYLMSRK